jgi:putative flippase GtrA
VISFAIVAAGVRAGLHYLLAQVLATLVTVFVTYEINRRWSFAMPIRR